MNYIVVIKEVISILGPLVLEIIKSLKDREVRQITADLIKAKTPEEKKDVAKKLADILYKS